MDAWNVDTRVNTTLAGLGIGQIDRDRKISELSGGQRARLSLAWLLLQSPQVLLLDEPTNHLALTLVTELDSALSEYPGIVVIASHDRWLRSRWQSEVLHLHETAEQRRSLPVATRLPHLCPTATPRKLSVDHVLRSQVAKGHCWPNRGTRPRVAVPHDRG